MKAIHLVFLLAVFPLALEIPAHGGLPDEILDWVTIGVLTILILALAVVIVWQSSQVAAIESIDAVTGLFNRRRFKEDLQREVNRSERQNFPLSLAFLDIDHFKSILEKHGRSEGEAVIVKLAEVLKASMRVDVDACYWLGADEFAILMPDVTEQEATVILDRVWGKTASDSLPLHRYGAGITMALVRRTQGESAEALLQRADVQMFEAKRARKQAEQKQPVAGEPQPPQK